MKKPLRVNKNQESLKLNTNKLKLNLRRLNKI